MMNNLFKNWVLVWINIVCYPVNKVWDSCVNSTITTILSPRSQTNDIPFTIAKLNHEWTTRITLFIKNIISFKYSIKPISTLFNSFTWQAPNPTEYSPAQIWLAVLYICEYLCLHLASVKIGIATCISLVVVGPPKYCAPHPVTQAVCDCTSKPGYGKQASMIYLPSILTGCLSIINYLDSLFLKKVKFKLAIQIVLSLQYHCSLFVS